MDVLTQNSQQKFQFVTDYSEAAKQIVKQTMQVLPPHLRELYLKMRTPLVQPDNSRKINTIQTSQDIADDIRLKSNNYIQPVASKQLNALINSKTKQDLEIELKDVFSVAPQPPETKLDAADVLKLDKFLFSDNELISQIPCPPICQMQLSKEENNRIAKQRQYFMQEMERFSQEVLKTIEKIQ